MDVECDTLLTEFNFERCDGSRYVGGFVRTTATRDQWLAPQIQQWVRGVEALAKVARRLPQTAYAGLARSLQQDWQYLQRVTPAVADAFGPVEAALADSFLPALLGEDGAGVVKMRELLALPVRLAGLGVPCPIQAADPCHEASTAATTSLTASLLEGTPLDATSFTGAVAASRRTNRKVKAASDAAKLAALHQTAPLAAPRRMLRSKSTIAWLIAMLDALNGAVLSMDEFREQLRADTRASV